MYTIFEISNWFLTKERLTPKKLQKLCYYAQAWNLALNKKKIIDCDFEAWVHGPVCNELYQEYKKYGWTPITKRVDTNITNPKDLELLESVWLTYGGYDGQQLESLTHQEDPWKNARRGLEPLESSNNKISERDMEDYYISKYIGG